MHLPLPKKARIKYFPAFNLALHMEKQNLEQFISFVGSISGFDRVALLHDTDADGVSAAVICAKALVRMRGKRPELVFTQHKRMVSIEPKTVFVLKKKKITKLIILDLAIDQLPSKVKEIEKFADIMVIDHHKVYHDLSSKKPVFLKASRVFPKIEPSKYATSKMCFDFFSKIVDLNDLAWVACVGLAGDFSLNAWKSFVDNTLKQGNITLSQIKSCTEIVNSVEIIHLKDISELFEMYFNAVHPKDILHSKFEGYKEKVEKELSRLVKEFDQKAEIRNEIELIYFEFKSKYSIKSYLINHLSSRLSKNRTIVLVEDVRNGVLTLSARRQDYKIKMNDLLEQSVKGLKGGIAGGHVPAAGGKIRKIDLAKFKDNLIRILSTNPPLK